MDLLKEQQDLEKAEADLVDAEARIQRQRRLLEEPARDGHDTTQAAELLRVLKGVQLSMIDHRNLIIQTIASIKQGRI